MDEQLNLQLVDDEQLGDNLKHDCVDKSFIFYGGTLLLEKEFMRVSVGDIQIEIPYESKKI